MPTADRACLPASPNTSTNRSDTPLTTAGCSVKVGAELTKPTSFTMRFDPIETAEGVLERGEQA